MFRCNLLWLFFFGSEFDFLSDLLSLSYWTKGKDPHPQDKSQHLDFTKDPRPLYYKTPPCVFYHKMSVVRPFSVLSKDEIGP